MIFWLGIHHADWLTKTAVPTMVSYRTLRGIRRLPRALGAWVQDSGGFTELDRHHGYRDSARVYAERSRRHAAEIGQLTAVVVQDWMCEDQILAKTGKSIAEHQRLTVESYLELRELAPELPWMPVLQGQVFDDYARHVDEYARSGVDLTAVPVVGVGTVCRRQHTMVAVRLLRDLASFGLRLHGFGLKITSVLRLRNLLFGSDSMSWSLDGRYPQGGRCRRVRDHVQCVNCLDWALLWRQRLVDRLSQESLWEFAA